MSLSREQMMSLMAYADGELEGSERADVETLVQSSEEARKVVEAMGVIGIAVRGATDDHANDAADGIADAVMRAIEVGAPARVISIQERRASRGRAVGIVIGVMSLAAAAIFYVRSAAPPTPTASQSPNEQGIDTPAIQPLPLPSAPEPAPSPAATVAAANPPVAPANGVDVEQVESPSHQVSVFYVPATAAAAEAHASSVVVWIDDRAATAPGAH